MKPSFSAAARAARFLVASIACVLAIAGCASGISIDESAREANREFFASIEAQARASVASDAQLEVLAQAVETGVLSAADVTPLFGEFFECIALTGGRGELDGVLTIAPGYSIPSYSIVVPEWALESDEDLEQWDLQTRTCEDEHIGYVWRAIQMQPSVIALKDSHLTAHRDEIVRCLDDLGYGVPQDATADELMIAIMTARIETDTVCYDLSP